MKIEVYESPQEVAQALARRVACAVRQQPAIVLGLPTGRSPIRTYQQLARMHDRGEFNASTLRTFNLDEFVGIDPSHSGSFRAFMEHHLFTPLRLLPEQVEFLNGAAPDLDAECVRYEAAIKTAGGLDLQILGIGANGHIGFNEPSEALQPRTHRVTLAASTRRDNAALFDGDPERVPREALSMGVGTILDAAAIVLLAVGDKKAQCIERAVRGPVTTRLPASFLQLHRRVELFLDRSAASRL